MASSLLLDRLLRPLGVPDFLQAHWLTQPAWGRGTAAEHAPLALWPQVERLVTQTPCDLICARDGAIFTGPRPSTSEAAKALLAQGYSLALRQPDQHDPGLAVLGRTFVAELFGRLNLHLYCSPRGHGSFGWHCDPEEVFILQTSGRKKYALRENTVNPSPLGEALGTLADLRKETSPTAEVELAEGDWLYIPGGFWHTTEALEDSTSISVGVLPPCPLDLLDLLRAELARLPEARRRLPPLGRADATPDAQKLARAQDQLAAFTALLQARAQDPSAALRFFARYGMAGMRGRR